VQEGFIVEQFITNLRVAEVETSQ